MNQHFLNELKGCIRGLESLRPENIEWLFAVSKKEDYEDELLEIQHSQIDIAKRFVRKYDLSLNSNQEMLKHDYRCLDIYSKNQKYQVIYNKRKYIQQLYEKNGSTIIDACFRDLLEKHKRSVIKKYGVEKYDKKNKVIPGYGILKIKYQNKNIELLFNRELFVKGDELLDSERINGLFIDDANRANAFDYLIDKDKNSSDEVNNIMRESKSTSIDNRYKEVYKEFVKILTAEISPSREFLILFSVFCERKSLDINRMLSNTGYSCLIPDRGEFDKFVLEWLGASDRKSFLMNRLVNLEIQQISGNKSFNLDRIIYDSINEELTNITV